MINNELTYQKFIGNGSATVFTVTDLEYLNKAENLKVIRYCPSLIVEFQQRTLILNTHYTVDAVTGEITTILDPDGLAIPYDSTVQLTVITDVDFTQKTDITSNSNYDPEVLETAYDKSVILAKQNKESIDRTVKLSPSDTGSNLELPPLVTSAGGYIYIKSDGGTPPTFSLETHPGPVPKTWDQYYNYLSGQITQHAGDLWICSIENSGEEPTETSSYWERYTDRRAYWNKAITYSEGDGVFYQDTIYFATSLAGNKNKNPITEPAYWTKMNLDTVSQHIIDTTESTSSSTGALVVDGGVGIGKNLNVKGKIKASNISGKNPFSDKKQNGLIIPMYIYPSDIFYNTTYQYVFDFARRNKDIPIIMILNPENGAGTVVDGNYTYAILKAQASGIRVVGYVSTDYGNRDIALVKADIDKWLEFYPTIEGIFFDEQQWDDTQIDYYTELSNYTSSKNLFLTIGNPGSNCNNAYFDIFSIVINFETDQGWPTDEDMIMNYIDGVTVKSFYKRGLLKLGQTSWDVDNFKRVLPYYGWVYVTDDLLSPNPWDNLSNYFDEMAYAISNPSGLRSFDLTSANVTYTLPTGIGNGFVQDIFWENGGTYKLTMATSDGSTIGGLSAGTWLGEGEGSMTVIYDSANNDWKVREYDDSGRNSNGNWKKEKDGILSEFGIASITIPATAANGNQVVDITVFPMAFISEASISVELNIGYGEVFSHKIPEADSNISSFRLYLKNVSSYDVTEFTGQCFWQAKGRWRQI